MRVEFFRHNIGPEEKELLLKSLDSIFITTGQLTSAFEENLSRYLNAEYAIGLTSCTAALHLSLLAMGIGPGDEVITTPMTFAATSLAILHTGATPVWVDVEPHTGNLDANLIEEAITPRTRAILPVHLYGQMCDMRKIRAIADRHNLFIIEDAAHALESERDGIRVGELGDTACFSFYATKSITSGEGGAVTTNSVEIAEKIRTLRLHGINKEAIDRYTSGYQHWDLHEIGWKYNMFDIQAALLIPQLNKTEVYRQRRAGIDRTYRKLLRDIEGVTIPQIYPDSKSGFHLFTVWVDTHRRDRVLSELGKKGIGAAVNYRSINLLKKFLELFGKKKGAFPNSEKIGESTISLPFYPSLREDEVVYVVQNLKKILNT